MENLYASWEAYKNKMHKEIDQENLNECRIRGRSNFVVDQLPAGVLMHLARFEQFKRFSYHNIVVQVLICI